MKGFFHALCASALAFAGLTQARPVVIEEVSTFKPPPDTTWSILGRFGVGIDGHWAMVSGERFVPQADGSQRHEGAVFLYHKSPSSPAWGYEVQSGPAEVITDRVTPGFGIKDGNAIVVIDRARAFEGGGANAWGFLGYVDIPGVTADGPDVEVDHGRVLVPYLICSYSDFIAHKIVVRWELESFLFGQGNDCTHNVPSASGDLQGDRAAILNPRDPIGGSPTLRLYSAGSSTGGWYQFQQVDDLKVPGMFGSYVAMTGPYIAVTGRVTHGTNIFHEQSPLMYTRASTGLQAVDAYLEPGEWSGSTLERAGTLFAQRNYSYDRKAYVVNLFRVNDDEAHTSTHVATLQTRNGTSLGSWMDYSDNRIIVGDYTGNDGNNAVRVFELPTSFETPDVQMHDFESSSDGAAWQPTAGSAFSVTRVGNSGVYRQTSTAGDAASFVAPGMTTQAIQAEVTIRNVAGDDRWVGLVTRRSDASNYYYVTLRTSGVVQLKRMRNGVFATLASKSANVVVGRKYRLRLESVGVAHRVYLDDQLVLTARDTNLRTGVAGIAMYRASADYDNVIVTPGALTTIYTQDFSSTDLSRWNRTHGTWQAGNGVLHQTYNGDYARASIGTSTEDQVVRARIRPVSFRAAGTWVGLMARYLDARNYLYVSLVDRGRVSLWRRTNGMTSQLATADMDVSPGTWYDVRVEIVKGLTRVYVNNQLRISTSADPGPSVGAGVEQKGQVGLVTFRATADFDDFRAYQP
jgi:hypothetical protein